MFRSIKVKEIVLGMILCVAATQVAYSQVIFQENFDGAGIDDLGASANATWITAFSRANGGTDNNAASIFGADGSIDKVADGTGGQHDASAVLAITGGLQANSVYTLTATINNNNGNWTAVGFASADATLDGSNGRFSNGNPAVVGGYAWGLSRSNAGTDQEFFNGIGTGGPNAANGDIADPTQDVTIKVVLDTADTAAIKAEYFLNGTSVGPVETLAAAAFTDIGFVGISSDGGAAEDNPNASTISNFTLSVVTSSVVLGDVNMDGTVDFLDISPFIAVLSGGTFQAEADCDESGEVDFLDISPFIAILSGS